MLSFKLSVDNGAGKVVSSLFKAPTLEANVFTLGVQSPTV